MSLFLLGIGVGLSLAASLMCLLIAGTHHNRIKVIEQLIIATNEANKRNATNSTAQPQTHHTH